MKKRCCDHPNLLRCCALPSPGAEICHCFQPCAPPAPGIRWPRSCCLHLHFSSPAAGCWHQPCWAPAAPASLQLLASFLPPNHTRGASGPSDAREGCDCSNEPSKQAPRGATRDTTLVVLPSPGSGTGTETKVAT